MTSRERFEAHLRTRGYVDADFEKSHGHYSLYALNMQFDGWQAAEAATVRRCAEIVHSLKPPLGRAWSDHEVQTYSALLGADSAILAEYPEAFK